MKSFVWGIPVREALELRLSGASLAEELTALALARAEEEFGSELPRNEKLRTEITPNHTLINVTIQWSEPPHA